MTTFTDKVSIVSELARGMTPEFLAELYQTTEAEINNIGVNHQLIIEVGHYYNISQHLPLLAGHYPRMENILHYWFADHVHVSNRALSEKARQILDIIGERPKIANATAFTGTQNWVRCFKARYRNISIGQSQRLSEDTDAQIEPVLLSNDEIKLEMEFEAKAEQPQSQFPQSFDDETSTVDDQKEIANSQKRPAVNEDEYFPSEELPESSERDLNTETLERTETPTPTNRKPSTVAADADASLSSGKRSRKRKTSSIDEPEKQRKINKGNNCPTDGDPDEYSSSEDVNESVPPNKRDRSSVKVLVPTRTGVKSMSLQDYKEDKVIRIFKPLLKFAKDSGWSSEDSAQLNRLYSNSLLSCGGKHQQPTITNFFRKKK